MKSTIFINDDLNGGDCILIGTWNFGDEITLDGDGHTVTGPGSGNGIYLYPGIGVTAKNLNIRNFTQGILSHSNSNTIVGNTIHSNEIGIFLDSGSNNTIVKNNTISNNSSAGGVSITATNNQIYNNNFIDNGTQAFDYGIDNTFNLPAPIGGNYWSNWTTPDSNSDGFVDEAYVFTGGQDNLPYTTQNGWETAPDEDTTQPVTTITLEGTMGSNDWHVSEVEVTLTATDDDSGVDLTEYSLDGTSWNPYTAPFTIDDEGETTIYYRSTDIAENVETTKSETLKIDKTAPEITIANPEDYGLYTIGTPLDFTANDPLSGVFKLVGELTNTEGLILEVKNGFSPAVGVYTLIVRADDNAGNTIESETYHFVIYDPDGGFVTGGGWFYPDGEEGGLSPDGKTNFGFVAKYDKKEKATGHLEFQYHGEEGLNLKSTSIDWITVSDTSAGFQGTATLDGEGLYTFRIKVKDGGKIGTEDSFDIKIWLGTDTEADPVRKAKNTLAGGNIVIHKKK